MLIKRFLVKKLLYSGVFKLRIDFQLHGQKIKACLFICVNKFWLLNDFFEKHGFIIMVMILSNEALISCLLQFYISKAGKIMRKQCHCHLHLVSYCLFIKFVQLKGAFYWESCFFSIMLELIFSLTLRVIVNKLLYSFNLYFRSDFFYKITWEKINSSWMLNTTLVWSCKARIVNCTLSIRVLRTKL